jgi:hypothetical protein
MFATHLNRLWVLFLAIGTIGLAEQTDPHPQSISGLLKSPAHLDLLKLPARVSACILTLPNHNTVAVKKLMLSGEAKYEEGAYVEVSLEIQETLKKTLLDDQSYRWNVATGCIPLFQARVRFYSGDHYLDADLCLRCSIVAFSGNGKLLGYGIWDSDKVGTGFIDSMRKLFPSEPAFAAKK